MVHDWFIRIEKYCFMMMLKITIERVRAESWVLIGVVNMKSGE